MTHAPARRSAWLTEIPLLLGAATAATLLWRAGAGAAAASTSLPWSAWLVVCVVLCALRAMTHADHVAERFGELFGRPVQCGGAESPDALLNNGHGGYPLLGAPSVTAESMMRWTAEWIARGGESLGKPTHFQVRDGKF